MVQGLNPSLGSSTIITGIPLHSAMWQALLRLWRRAHPVRFRTGKQTEYIDYGLNFSLRTDVSLS